MKNPFTARLLLFIAFTAVGVLSPRARAVSSTRLVVVVARNLPVKDLPRSALKRLFTGSSVTLGDARLVPFNYEPGSRERAAFDRAVLGMSQDEAGRFWIDRKVRGQSGAPRSLPSAAYMAKVIELFPSAIGYLPEDQLSSKLQPVAIDGVPFDDPRYDIIIE